MRLKRRLKDLEDPWWVFQVLLDLFILLGIIYIAMNIIASFS